MKIFETSCNLHCLTTASFYCGVTGWKSSSLIQHCSNTSLRCTACCSVSCIRKVLSREMVAVSNQDRYWVGGWVCRCGCMFACVELSALMSGDSLLGMCYCDQWTQPPSCTRLLLFAWAHGTCVALCTFLGSLFTHKWCVCVCVCVCVQYIHILSFSHFFTHNGMHVQYMAIGISSQSYTWCVCVHTFVSSSSSIHLSCGCRTVVSASLSGISSLEYSFVENEDDIFMR